MMKSFSDTAKGMSGAQQMMKSFSDTAVSSVDTPFLDSIQSAVQDMKSTLTKIENRLPELKRFVQDCKIQRRSDDQGRVVERKTITGGYRRKSRKSRKSHKSRKGRKTRKH